MKKFYYFIVITLLMFFCSGVIIAQPQPPILLYPPNGATNIPLFFTFDWSDVTGATSYRLQVFQGAYTILDQSGITQSQYEITSAILQANTTYYWRVNATGPSGTSQWSTQFSFTTTTAPPAAPELLSPPNGSTNVTLTPTLSWNSVPGANYYNIQVSTNSGFSTTVVNVTGINNPGYTITSGILTTNTLYYWRVSATNNGGTSPWSTVWNFTTVPPLPGAPNLLSPANGATNVSTTPLLDWSDVSGATSYRVQIALNSGFTALVYDQSEITVSQHNVPSGILSGNTTYYWRVLAANSAGEGPWSTSRYFTTGTAPPAAPMLLYPPNNATGVSLTPTLDWNDVPSATTYRVQVSTNSGFTTTVVNMLTGSSSQYTIPSGVLSYNVQYYWRVRASNAGGDGQWSSVWNFTTSIQPPAAPTLISPPNMATGISLTPLLDWSDVTGASYYRVQMSTLSSFATTVLDVSNITQSQFNVPSGVLTGNTQYYWRVCAYNEGGQGPWASAFRFTTVQTFYLNLKVYLEGFYDGTNHVQDTIKVYLAQPTSPFTLRDSSNAFLSTSGTALISFEKAPNGNYYIIVKHRNHLETWSNTAPAFATGSTTNYDFTTAANKAYGNNMKQVGSAWVLYGGDGNQDGYINPTDYDLYKTQFGRDGYKSSDYNGDNYVDGYDLPILYSNFGKNFIRPY